MFALIIRKFKNIRRSKIDSPMFWVAALAIPVLSIAVLLVVLTHMSQLVAFIVVAGIFAVNFLAVYLYDNLSAAYEDKLKSALHTQEKEYYFAQCQLMQESLEHMKSIRHDMKTHLSTIRGYSIKIGADEITNYVNGLLDDADKNEVYSDTGNIAFDSIINFKLKNAKEAGIQLDLRLSVPPALGIEDSDIVAILGNLLDNALDAVEKVENKRIELDVEYSRESLFIKIDNTFDGEVKYETKKDICEKYIITRKKSSEHGHGLKNIRKSVDKYNGQVDIAHNGDVFSVTILIYVG